MRLVKPANSSSGPEFVELEAAYMPLRSRRLECVAKNLGRNRQVIVHAAIAAKDLDGHALNVHRHVVVEHQKRVKRVVRLIFKEGVERRCELLLLLFVALRVVRSFLLAAVTTGACTGLAA